MRRKDREITDNSRISEIISQCDCCRIGLIDENNHAYIVPMNFGFKSNNDSFTLYFHCANAGKKLDLMKAQREVSFEMDSSHKLVVGNTNCDYSYKYSSVMGIGKLTFITDTDKKAECLGCIMSHYCENTDNSFSDSALSKTTVLQLEIIELSCKEHI